MKILIADAFDDSLPGRLTPFGEVTQDAAKIAEAEVLLVRSKTKVTKEYLDAAPNLKLIIRGGVGLDNIDVETARGKGIEVKNTPRASSVAVAELTMALMLAVPNRIIEGHNGIKEGKFLKKELKRTELYGKTLGLLGAGLIGTEVARRALAFGMRVVAHDHYISNHALADMVEEGFPEGEVTLTRFADAKYPAQIHELTIPVPGGRPLTAADGAAMAGAFHELHERMFTYCVRQSSVDLFHWRVVAHRTVQAPQTPPLATGGEAGAATPKGSRRVYFADIGDYRETPVYDGDRLERGRIVSGPAVVEQENTTIVVFPGQRLEVNEFGDFILSL